MFTSRKVKLSTFWLLIFGILALNLGPAKAQSSEFLYQQDPEHVVVDYHLRSSFPYYGEPLFGLKLFGDGKIVASLPEGFPKNAIKKRGYVINRRGFFEARLTPEEMAQLLSDIEPALLIDPVEMKQERKRKLSTRGRTDGAVTKLFINLLDYRPALGEWKGPIRLSVEWMDIYGDARLYLDIADIQAFREADRDLPKWVFRIAAQVDAMERKQ